MIPGVNKLILNEPALLDAVQQYLDRKSGGRIVHISAVMIVRNDAGLAEVHFTLEGSPDAPDL